MATGLISHSKWDLNIQILTAVMEKIVADGVNHAHKLTENQCQCHSKSSIVTAQNS
jgi:hypothetical protein